MQAKKIEKEGATLEGMQKNVVIASFDSYNERRYGRPWVCKMDENHNFDFTKKVGCYDAEDGDEGDLIVFEPEIDAIYAYGQKDYRNFKHTWKSFKKWTESGWERCTKTGRKPK